MPKIIAGTRRARAFANTVVCIEVVTVTNGYKDENADKKCKHNGLMKEKR
jgi:hypothetical protein